MPGTIYNQVSRDAQIALNEFSSAFDAALAVINPDTWAEQYGLTNSSNAIRTTYPLPISAAGYKERTGDDKLRALFERSMSMVNKEWYDGVTAPADLIEAPDFIGWGTEPQRIAIEAQRLPNTLIAALLAANPLLDLYRDELPGGSVASTIHLFDNSHPVNILDSSFGTFDNDHAFTAIDEAWVAATKLRFRQKKGPNGQPLGLRFDTLFVPSAREDEALDFFEQDTILDVLMNVAGDQNVAAAPKRNRHKGTVRVVVCDELTSDDVIYPMCAASLAKPWIVQHRGTIEEIRYDKNSEMYKNTGKLAVKYVKRMGVAAAMPHAIERHTAS